jgi:hypothetical protein
MYVLPTAENTPVSVNFHFVVSTNGNPDECKTLKIQIARSFASKVNSCTLLRKVVTRHKLSLNPGKYIFTVGRQRKKYLRVHTGELKQSICKIYLSS